jgi:hypothetical protein
MQSVSLGGGCKSRLETGQPTDHHQTKRGIALLGACVSIQWRSLGTVLQVDVPMQQL